MKNKTKTQRKKLLNGLQLAIATTMFVTPVVTDISQVLVYAQDASELNGKPMEQSSENENNSVENVEQDSTYSEAQKPTDQELSQMGAEEEPSQTEEKVSAEEVPGETSEQMTVPDQTEQSAHERVSNDKKENDQTIEKETGLSSRSYENHEINWDNASKILTITSNRANVNDIATNVANDFSNAVGQVIELRLSGTFDNAKLQPTNSGIFDCRTLSGNVTVLAPNMFTGTSSIETVLFPQITSFYGNEFSTVTTIKTVEVGMKESDTLETVRGVFSDSKDSITNLMVHNIAGTGDFKLNAVPFPNLEQVSLPNATSIGNYAFYRAPVTSIDIPKVTSIGQGAF
ncbi:leucine-rich repeat protein, partial [Enterococcus faecium]|uniref:leucine-rich repeat protein n=1 Tax=Enterococcus faecium TaxID=1352 RepID=UPI000B69B491